MAGTTVYPLPRERNLILGGLLVLAAAAWALLVWSALGFAAYAGAVAAEQLAGHSSWLMDNGGRIGGVVLLLAGIDQVTPLKHICLGKCRSPLDFAGVYDCVDATYAEHGRPSIDPRQCRAPLSFSHSCHQRPSHVRTKAMSRSSRGRMTCIQCSP